MRLLAKTLLAIAAIGVSPLRADSVESKAVSNGQIPEGEAFAFARGRWRSLTLTANDDSSDSTDSGDGATDGIDNDTEADNSGNGGAMLWHWLLVLLSICPMRRRIGCTSRLQQPYTVANDQTQ